MIGLQQCEYQRNGCNTYGTGLDSGMTCYFTDHYRLLERKQSPARTAIIAVHIVLSGVLSESVA